MENIIKDAFLGLAIGDALGVPVEFKSRETLAKNPVVDMREYGTHNQPMGTWSDDSSLAFCIAESLCNGYDVEDIGKNFVRWYKHDFWTAHDELFDIGISTSEAIERLVRGDSARISGNYAEKYNGNGSLMRTLPLIFHIKDMDIAARFSCVSEVSSITHSHICAVMSCFVYTEFALELLKGAEKFAAYSNMQHTVNAFFDNNALFPAIQKHRFRRILEKTYGTTDKLPLRRLIDCKEEEILSSGFVLDTLEASIWCFLKYDNYADTVLKAVNLGDDTDTTACVAGGLAGLYYGADTIPQAWRDVLAKKEDIEALSERLFQRYYLG